jgi:hypothetical protein
MADTGAGKSNVAIGTAEMLEHERAAVAELRDKAVDEKIWLGLALSGGGIRSASFAMGVMQAFDGASVMQRFDYLSTVSGGGYIGSSLSYFVHEHAKHWPEPPNETPKFWFPFGKRGQTGARGDRVFAGVDTRQRGELLQDSLAVQIVSFIRQQAHYLTPTPKLGVIALIANAMRAVLFSVGIYFAILVALMVIVFRIGVKGSWLYAAVTDVIAKVTAAVASGATIICDCVVGKSSLGEILEIVFTLPCSDGAVNIFAVVGTFAIASFMILTLVYSFGSYFVVAPASTSGTKDPSRFFYLRLTIPLTAWLGRLLLLQLACVVLGSLPYIYGLATAHGGNGNVIGAASVAIAYVGTWYEKRSAMLGKLTSSGMVKAALPYIYAALAIYGVLFLAFGVAQDIIAYCAGYPWLPLLILSAGVLLLGWVVNLNLSSQHRMYRDRLMEALCPDLEAVMKGTWRPAPAADALQLSQLPGGTTSKMKGRIVAPYHLINTALIIPGSKQPKYNGRGADSFVLSANWCGSDATRWAPTDKYMSDRMVLPTAMAISGAALNAHSGGDGKGALRSSAISFLVTLFGVQLGYWAPNPRGVGNSRISLGQTTPNYIRPGIRGLLGWHMNERAGFVQLSDGGHFENLGLYELIRRKMSLIVVSDGGQDAGFAFEDLGNAIERVRVDFGVGINFTVDKLNLEGVLPAPGDVTSTSWLTKFGLAKRGFAAAWIDYPDQDARGILLYIKATMIEGLPSDLYAYKALNREFPDQSTIDQDFDETQFEAYRELGYRLTKEMIEQIRDKPALEDSPEAELIAAAKALLGFAGTPAH